MKLLLICAALCLGFWQGAMADELKLDLYYKVDCPFCQKVVKYFYQNGIAIGLKDIKRDEAFKDELVELTGRAQVPCLSINGVMLHESGDIIQWFEENITKSVPSR